MADSSVDNRSPLKGVRPRHVFLLLEIVQRSKLRDRSFIAQEYSDVATSFDETLSFLAEIGWLSIHQSQLVPTGDVIGRIVDAQDTERAIAFADGLWGSHGPYSHLFAHYLSQFQLVDGALIYRPSLEHRLRDADIRDFLMDLGAISHRVDGDYFVLEQPFKPWAVWARGVLGSHRRTDRTEDQESLGIDAELVVLEWERNRVGTDYRHRVRHVAKENPFACFDIQSVSSTGNSTEPRFIEVKAVPAGSFEFHWSSAEIEAAEILGDRYFLYLVPVLASREFRLGEMEIVQNPYDRVYRNPAEWSSIATHVICRKRISSIDS